jgi:nucleotide-binding universal stress UspA family protein
MFTKIVFGTDFTIGSSDAEREVADLAQKMGASVIALHAVEPIDPGGDQEPFQEFYRSLRAAAGEKLSAVAKRFRDRGIPCEAKVTVGPRWKEVIDEAMRAGADLIVLGSRPRADTPAPGTTSHKVFWASPIPVLFVRAPSQQA